MSAVPASVLTVLPVSLADETSLATETPPPVPMITEAPASLTYDTSVHFEFSDQGQHGTFLCRLDNGPFTPCSPAGTGYQGLGLGRHCFYVLAVQGEVPERPQRVLLAVPTDTVSGDYEIGGNAADPFYPGTSEPLDLVITNPFKFAIKVLTVSVTVGPVPTRNGVPDPDLSRRHQPAGDPAAWATVNHRRLSPQNRSRTWACPRPSGRR